MKKISYAVVILLMVLVVCSNDRKSQALSVDVLPMGDDIVAVYAEETSSLDPAGSDDVSSDQRRHVLVI